MSYARKGPESDVYVWGDSDGNIHCQQCALGMVTTQERDPATYYHPSARHMLEHLRRHVAAGHKVPDSALTRLELEASTEWRDMPRTNAPGPATDPLVFIPGKPKGGN